jgi:hypothetical protein
MSKRRISVEDGQMRHGRKSRSVLVDGDTRHVLHDLDSALIRAVGVTPVNAPEASVTEAGSRRSRSARGSLERIAHRSRLFE